MLQKIIIFLTILILAAAQVSLFPNLMPGGLAPDAVLLLVIFWAARYRFDRVWLRVALAGLILDVLTSSALGLNVAAFAIAAFGVGSLAKRLKAAQKPLATLVLFGFVVFGTLAYGFSFTALAVAASHFSGVVTTQFSGAWLAGLFFRIIYNLILFGILYWPFRKMEIFFQVAPTKTLIK
ncbi:MAG: rod shape-determining protein MreD [Candidatus Pacebacteria bacterium]|nr:rod shape-determining protein MreD [Candidatus Paceibacterota bacterium]MDR3582837.1 rod shape-determining protein MreD [Candidatus Paceibacterota bacterium]